MNETIQKIMEVIRPKRIILFGSAVRGEMHENSDIDLLIIVPSGTHRRKTAQKIYRNMIGIGFATDLVVTEDDIKEYRNDPCMIIRQALDEGEVLYAA